MNKDEIDILNQKVIKLTEDLATTKLALGTLVVWLQAELGQKNATDLLEQLNG